jgi:hypothetical protein
MDVPYTWFQRQLCLDDVFGDVDCMFHTDRAVADPALFSHIHVLCVGDVTTVDWTTCWILLDQDEARHVLLLVPQLASDAVNSRSCHCGLDAGIL